MQICRGFTHFQWKKLSAQLHNEDGSLNENEKLWDCAIQVFERRIRERFISCIDALERSDSRADVEVDDDDAADCSALPTDSDVVVPGFAIMALACLLCETLSSFRRKPEVEPGKATNDAFRKFLRRPAFRGAFAEEDIATKFARGNSQRHTSRS